MEQLGNTYIKDVCRGVNPKKKNEELFSESKVVDVKY
jgi:hypothetical protein